jgi:hypothetical protein
MQTRKLLYFVVHYLSFYSVQLGGIRYMATDSRTWFYTTPAPRPYFIEERVNHTLWKNRLQGLSMTCTQAANPIKMEGVLNGIPVQFEFQPGKYFTLRMGREVKELIGVVRQMLMMRPAFMYTDASGMSVVEWHTDDSEARFKQIEGSSGYMGARRLKKG